MPKQASIKSSISLPEDLHWRFKRAAALRRVSDTEALRQALSEWSERAEIESTDGLAAPGQLVSRNVLAIETRAELNTVRSLLLALRDSSDYAKRAVKAVEIYRDHRQIEERQEADEAASDFQHGKTG